MKLEQQVTSLELSNKLKTLGVKQESYFHHYKGVGGWFYLGDNADLMNNAVDFGRMTAPQFESYAAFTVGELGEMLPDDTKSYRSGGNWFCWAFKKMRHGNEDLIEQADTEADARAKMLVYLIESKLITI